jgi:hypothetical protein
MLKIVILFLLFQFFSDYEEKREAPNPMQPANTKYGI